MNISFLLEDITRILQDGVVEGSLDQPITGIASLAQAQPGDLAFLGNRKYTPDVKTCRASVILLFHDYEGAPAPGQAFVRLENPSLGLARLCGAIEAMLWPKPQPGVHATAVIDESAEVDPTAWVGPYCVVGAGAKIGPGSNLESLVTVGREASVGAQCRISAHVSIGDYCEVGDRVRLHPGVVIGSDGFGFETNSGVHEKVPQIGNVVIENDVEIGANTTIDRARFSSTRIGEGSKLDNLVQIAHNVVIGKGCLIVAQAGISGSTTMEDFVIVAGQAGITGHLTLAKGSVIGAQTGLHNDTQPGAYYRGSPANTAALQHRIDILSKRLPELFKRVASLEKKAAG
ncbi:MAG: UDP-3-O-(3-hydroxymyristoyl)glucosamine N-acyltransferase [Puniceicoccales bacterium]